MDNYLTVYQRDYTYPKLKSSIPCISQCLSRKNINSYNDPCKNTENKDDIYLSSYGARLDAFPKSIKIEDDQIDSCMKRVIILS